MAESPQSRSQEFSPEMVTRENWRDAEVLQKVIYLLEGNRRKLWTVEINFWTDKNQLTDGGDSFAVEKPILFLAKNKYEKD